MARVSRFILGIIVRSIEQKVLFNKDCNSNIRQDESFSISLFIRTSCDCFVAGFAIVFGPGASRAVASGIATEKGTRKDGPTAASSLGRGFYNVILQEEPLKSTTVKQIIKSFRWAPFLPVATDNSMLSVLLLLSKYRLRSVPIIETGNPFVKNFNTGQDGARTPKMQKEGIV
ncbi:hypothetical protein IFM89_000250 [Coptis chinensis]|uniref:CBS domain-containing protein n=1 Tax=Coptis chinensis TaxID=261450 RepID=A0A835IJ48_9MAGN|nr:hypothetical protein IFM89_000250 [Coptis chinensis]